MAFKLNNPYSLESPTYMIANTLASTAIAGSTEYNGTALYFTPLATQRGLLPAMQYYKLENGGWVGQNSTSAQGFFGGSNPAGLGVSLNGNTIYEFEALYAIAKTSGTTSHNVLLAFGGTAIINNIAYHNLIKYNTSSFASVPSTDSYSAFFQTASASGIFTGLSSANIDIVILSKGTVSTAVGGTFIPQYQLSAAPGGAYTTQVGSYFKIWPVNFAGSNTSIGTWT
jgi:hypothetical protein